MRSVGIGFLLFLFIAPAAVSADEWPLWDGHESVESYAKRVNLPPTKSIDLGSGVTLDLVLIPAGKFIMGTPEPPEPNGTIEQSITMIAVGGILTIAMFVVLRRRYKKTLKRNFSLGWLLLLTITIGIFFGGIAQGFRVQDNLDRTYQDRQNYGQALDNEKHAHSVKISRPFYMGKFPVTQEQYRAMTSSNPSLIPGKQLPVESVSWEDGINFCKKLTAMLKLQNSEVSLPTEAQWEYACRAGTQTLL